jgi:Right handed beta helix region
VIGRSIARLLGASPGLSREKLNGSKIPHFDGYPFPFFEETTMTTLVAFWRSFSSFATTLAVLVLLATGSAVAADLTVICPNGGTGAYPSITAALNAITNNAGPNSINVSGTCTENIFILNQSNLNIFAASGAKPVITNAASPAQITIQLFGSRVVNMSGLDIQGGDPGVLVNDGSDLTITNSVIENNVGGGIGAQSRSSVDLESSIIRNNGGVGLEIGDLSEATLSTAPNQATQILNNGGAGIAVDPAGYLQFNFGGHVIEGNAGPALTADGGRVVIFSASPTIFRNNGGGLEFRTGSAAEFFGLNTIQNNGPVGITVEASTVKFHTVFSNGVQTVSSISGHTSAGVSVSRGGELTFIGAHRVTGNGSLPAANTGGILVERSSLSLLNGATVSNNTGNGILGDANSAIVLGPTASITHNTGPGVRLRHKSLVGLTAPVTIQGNGNSNIACDSTSLAYGQLGGITGVQCEQ